MKEKREYKMGKMKKKRAKKIMRMKIHLCNFLYKKKKPTDVFFFFENLCLIG